MKAGFLDGPPIRQLHKNEGFIGTMMSEIEKVAWMTFKNLVRDFLGNAQSYPGSIQQLLESFKLLGDELGERFHQDLTVMEARHQGTLNVHMMADYCWTMN